MTRKEVEDLLNSLYSKADYELMFKRTESDQSLFNLLWEMIKEMPQKDSWRLMWILDHATEKKNDFIIPILNDLYLIMLETSNESFIRHGMKLILRCPIIEDYAGELLEQSIKWMNMQKAKISSQVLGLEFFFKTCQLYPEMTPELIAYIDDILEKTPSAGFKFRLREIRKKIM